MVPLLAGIGLFAVGIAVRGETTCPAASEVEARVRALAPADEEGAGEARLEQLEGRLRITLVRPSGAVVGERIIEGEHPCQELADVAAVVVAAWMSDERTAAAPLVLPPPPRVAPPLPVSPARRSRDPALELGAGIGTSVAGGVAPAGQLAASWAPGGGRLAGRLAAVLTGVRQVPLPAGVVRWRRSSLALGPALRARVGPLAVEPRASFAAGWLTVEGRGFAEAERHSSVVAGVEAGVRLGLRRRGWGPCLDVGGWYWPGRSVAYQEPDQAQTVLPAFELLLTLGVAFAP